MSDESDERGDNNGIVAVLGGYYAQCGACGEKTTCKQHPMGYFCIPCAARVREIRSYRCPACQTKVPSMRAQDHQKVCEKIVIDRNSYQV